MRSSRARPSVLTSIVGVALHVAYTQVAREVARAAGSFAEDEVDAVRRTRHHVVGRGFGVGAFAKSALDDRDAAHENASTRRIEGHAGATRGRQEATPVGISTIERRLHER